MTDTIFKEVTKLQKLMAWHQFYTETESVQKKLTGSQFTFRSRDTQKEIEAQKAKIKEMKDEEARKISEGKRPDRGYRH